MFHAMRNDWGRGQSLEVLAYLAAENGDLPLARACYEECPALALEHCEAAMELDQRLTARAGQEALHRLRVVHEVESSRRYLEIERGRTASLADALKVAVKAREAQRDELQITAHDLRNPIGAIRSIAEILGEHLPDSGPERELCASIGALADAGLEMLNNQLSNAIKFSQPESPVRLSVRVRGEGVILTCTDAGPGLQEDDMHRIFGKFQRLSARPTGMECSHGLGLYIVKRLVDALAGRVWAENNDTGRGCSFHVLLKPAGGTSPRPSSRC
jgi:signal transduction histidine kinase